MWIKVKIFSFTFLLMEERHIPCNIGRHVAELNKNIIIVAINVNDFSSGINIAMSMDKI